MNNEEIIRNAYRLAEIKDVPSWVAGFTEDGTYTDESIGAVNRGPKEVGRPVEIYAKAFQDMHRELYKFYVTGDIVVVQLALQGTHTISPTSKRMDAPCCDVFQLKDGKIQRFGCYPSGAVIFSQLGLLTNLQAVPTH
jgi:ketosteroid isomerase-like protein